jgi:myxalamid-type polyketide synthase MxaE and MxaD
MADIPQAENELSTTKRALLAVQKLQAKVAALESARTEPIAIVGLGLRLPGGANSYESYWRLLVEGRDAISEVPAERWGREFHSTDPSVPGTSVSHYGGFIEGVDQFDAAFFGIPPRDADNMDPQHRLFLEVAWEALEDAGLPQARLSGTRTGVYLGLMTNDYVRMMWQDPRQVDAYGTTGFAFTFGPNRLSYLLDLQGPSMAVDTACSSSLVTVHLACQSLRSGESDLALAGGVNALLSPEASIAFSKMGMLSPDGRCKSFDARANGYVRGEGCAVFVLKRLSNALADGDRVLALIRGSAVNQDGRSNGFTAPNALAQEAAVRQALGMAGLEPWRISYVEAHGTGTSLGDPIEVEALRRVYGVPAEGAGPCVVGSVKTQIGHLEAAAGVAGMAKVVLAMQHRRLPANLHFQSLNPLINLEGTRLEIASTARAWDVAERHAAISSYGAGGTNSHAVLSEPPPAPALPPERPEEERVLVLSARSPEALRANAQAWHEWLRASEGEGTRDVCYTAALRRTHHDQRLAVVGRGREELAGQLAAWLAGEARPGVASGPAAERPPRVAFIFSGHGSEWVGMGRELLASEPTFRQALERCDEALRPHVGWSVVELLGSPDSERLMDERGALQPVTFALQVALAALWESWGVKPHAVVGHSLGEVAAACVAGVLPLEQAARLIAERARLVQRVRGQGGVAVLGLGPQEAERELESFAGRLWVSGHNAPRSTAVAGEVAALEELAARLGERGVPCRRVRMDFAAHSPHMEPLRGELVREMAGLRPQQASVPFYSSVTATRATGPELDAAYWGSNLREPVRFAAAVQRLVEEGYETFLEVSPHPLLLAAVEGTLRAADRQGLLLPTLRRGEPERLVALGSLAALHVAGAAVQWSALFPSGGRCVRLPTYAWQHTTHRVVVQAPTAQGANPRRGEHPLLGEHLTSSLHPGTHLWQVELSLQTQPWLGEHRVRGSAVLPAAAVAEMALAAARQLHPQAPMALHGLELTEALLLPEEGAVRVQLALTEEQGGGATFQVSSQPAQTRGGAWKAHSRGALRPTGLPEERVALAELEARCPQAPGAAWHYAVSRARGLEYGPAFQGVRQMHRGEGEALARLALPTSLEAEAPAYGCHPALLDASIQVLLAALPGSERVGAAADTWLPVRLEQVRLGAVPGGELACWARLTGEAEGGEVRVGELRLVGADGQVVLAVDGLHLRRVRQDVRKLLGEWLHEVRWEQAPVPAPARSRGGTWLVLGDDSGTWKELQAALGRRGERCVVALPGQDYVAVEPGRYQVRPRHPEDFQRLLQEAGLPDLGILHLWSLGAPEADSGGTRALLEAWELGCEGTLHLVQALARAGSMARLWLVTRRAQALAEDTAPANASQAGVWGMGRVLAHEHPELRCTLVDVGNGSAEELQALEHELAAGAAETHVALRGSRRYTARLVRGAEVPASPVAPRAEGTYLITGGLGGLGLVMARWLVEHGARHLLLVGRSAPSAEAEQRLGELRLAGATVTVARADVAEEEQVRQVLAQVSPTAPLRGVLHAAGLLEDGIALQQDRQRLRRVMAPKVLGAWHLHQLTRHTPLDFFVLFSSASAVLGTPGQSNYAAANTVLDTLAHERRARGLVGQSVQWGAWSEVGMAAAHGRGERLTQQGLGSLTPEQGTAALGLLLGTGPAQVAIMPLDASRWAAAHPSAARLPFFSALMAAQPAAPRAAASTLTRAQLLEAPLSERPRLVEHYLASLVGRLLRLGERRLDPERSLFSLGFDSLMALELRGRIDADLGASLTPAKFLEKPILSHIARLVLEQLPAQAESMPSPEEVENLSDEAMDELLRKMLSQKAS